MEKIKLAIFASGEGSNALQLIHYFEKNSWMEVALVVSNNKNSALLPKAEHAGIEVLFQTNEEVSQGESLTHRLNQKGIDWIVLAGFLRKIPSALLRAYPNHIINIHPSLLPKFGGKGMYGMHVHRAVIASGEIISGITIHFVTEHYDEGQIIAQYSLRIPIGTTAEELCSKIKSMEHEKYAEDVERVILENSKVV